MLETLSKLLSVLGIYDDYIADTITTPSPTVMKYKRIQVGITVTVLVADFVSTMLDWQVFFRLLNHDFFSYIEKMFNPDFHQIDFDCNFFRFILKILLKKY